MYFYGSPGNEKMWRHEWPDGVVWHMHGDRGNEYCSCVETPGGNRRLMSQGECAYQFLRCAPEDADPDALVYLHDQLRSLRFLPSRICRGTGLEGLAEKASRRQDEGENRVDVGDALSPVQEDEEEQEEQAEQAEPGADQAGGASENTPAQATPASKITGEEGLAMIPQENHGAEEVERADTDTCALAEAAPTADITGQWQTMTSAAHASPSGPCGTSRFVPSPMLAPLGGEVTPVGYRPRRISTGTSVNASPTSQTGGSCAYHPVGSTCESGPGRLGTPVHRKIAQIEQEPNADAAETARLEAAQLEALRLKLEATRLEDEEVETRRQSDVGAQVEAAEEDAEAEVEAGAQAEEEGEGEEEEEEAHEAEEEVLAPAHDSEEEETRRQAEAEAEAEVRRQAEAQAEEQTRRQAQEQAQAQTQAAAEEEARRQAQAQAQAQQAKEEARRLAQADSPWWKQHAVGFLVDTSGIDMYGQQHPIAKIEKLGQAKGELWFPSDNTYTTVDSSFIKGLDPYPDFTAFSWIRFEASQGWRAKNDQGSSFPMIEPVLRNEVEDWLVACCERCPEYWLPVEQKQFIKLQAEATIAPGVFRWIGILPPDGRFVPLPEDYLTSAGFSFDFMQRCRSSGRPEDCTEVGAAVTRSSKGSRSEARASGLHESVPGVFDSVRQTDVGTSRCGTPSNPYQSDGKNVCIVYAAAAGVDLTGDAEAAKMIGALAEGSLAVKMGKNRVSWVVQECRIRVQTTWTTLAIPFAHKLTKQEVLATPKPGVVTVYQFRDSSGFVEHCFATACDAAGKGWLCDMNHPTYLLLTPDGLDMCCVGDDSTFDCVIRAFSLTRERVVAGVPSLADTGLPMLLGALGACDDKGRDLALHIQALAISKKGVLGTIEHEMKRAGWKSLTELEGGTTPLPISPTSVDLRRDSATVMQLTSTCFIAAARVDEGRIFYHGSQTLPLTHSNLSTVVGQPYVPAAGGGGALAIRSFVPGKNASKRMRSAQSQAESSLPNKKARRA